MDEKIDGNFRKSAWRRRKSWKNLRCLLVFGDFFFKPAGKWHAPQTRHVSPRGQSLIRLQQSSNHLSFWQIFQSKDSQSFVSTFHRNLLQAFRSQSFQPLYHPPCIAATTAGHTRHTRDTGSVAPCRPQHQGRHQCSSLRRCVGS